MRDPLLWTYLPTDAAVDLLEQLRTPSSVVVYMCLADFEELASDRDQLVHAERGLVASSDLVLARGPSLAARCARWSGRVHEIDLGVALDAFPMPAEQDGGAGDDVGASIQPTPLAGLPRPVVGYVGALHRYLDLRLAVALAAARPDWSWVYVGPPQTSVGQLAARPNVHLTGPVPHSSLARYIESFDVGIVPYRLGSATDTVLPAKVLEYLAMGKPVVSTRLPEVRRFNCQHQVLVTAASEPEAFGRALEEALATDGEGLRVARRRAVAPLDWGAQLEQLSGLIESSVAPGVKSRQR
jgi:glycosyltransferase involved in cell wall biosynthesis